MLPREVRNRRGAKVTADDRDAGVKSLLGRNDTRRERAADGVSAEDAGVDMEEFHGCDPLLRCDAVKLGNRLRSR
jgi:hypothetical protein